MECGTTKTLNRKTFLYNGIFIHQNSKVVIEKIHDNDTIDVKFIDQEGNPHILENINQSELI